MPDISCATDLYESRHQWMLQCLQAVKHHFETSRHSAEAVKAEVDWKHKQSLDRSSLSEHLDDWVADMRAAGLKHNEPTLTALIQVSGLCQMLLALYQAGWPTCGLLASSIMSPH